MARGVVKTPAELFAEREKRITDAIALKVPDRVPIILSFGFLAAKRAGITYEEAMYDPVKMTSAWSKAMSDFDPISRAWT